MHDLVFSNQDSLGIKPWAKYAAEAGIPDRRAFDACLGATTPVRDAQENIAAANRLGLHGTPSVIINGWYLPGAPPTIEELREWVLAFRRGASTTSDVP